MGSVVKVETIEQLAEIDDRQIVSAMIGASVEEYVYEFTSGGRKVQGLTLAGINEAANHRGGYAVEIQKIEETPDSFRALIKATDKVADREAFGAYEQPKKDIKGRVDPYAYTKAIHKAQRNAIKQLLPQAQIVAIIQHYLGGSKSSGKRPQREQAPKYDDKLNMRGAFALWKKLESDFAVAGIDAEMFWGWVKTRYGVESRSEMTAENWAELASEMQAATQSGAAKSRLIAHVRTDAVEVTVEEEMPEEPTESPEEQEPEDDDIEF